MFTLAKIFWIRRQKFLSVFLRDKQISYLELPWALPEIIMKKRMRMAAKNLSVAGRPPSLSLRSNNFRKRFQKYAMNLLKE
jgi:hypothetical protein